jgi:hypothetical protein
MNLTVDLYSKLKLMTIEIKYENVNRVLPSEFDIINCFWM